MAIPGEITNSEMTIIPKGLLCGDLRSYSSNLKAKRSQLLLQMQRIIQNSATGYMALI